MSGNTNGDGYSKVLLSHLREVQFSPGVHHIEVRHNDDCGFFRDKPCDCEPVVESGARVERKYGGQS